MEKNEMSGVVCGAMTDIRAYRNYNEELVLKIQINPNNLFDDTPNEITITCPLGCEIELYTQLEEAKKELMSIMESLAQIM